MYYYLLVFVVDDHLEVLDLLLGEYEVVGPVLEIVLEQRDKVLGGLVYHKVQGLAGLGLGQLGVVDLDLFDVGVQNILLISSRPCLSRPLEPLHLLPLPSLELDLHLVDLLHPLLPQHELIVDLVQHKALPGHPGVLLDLCQRHPVLGVVRQHPLDKVLEGVGEMPLGEPAGVPQPELLELFLVESFVVLVGQLVGFLKRRHASIQQKEDDARSEVIHALTLVVFVVDFRGHVGLCPAFGMKHPSAQTSTEPKIDNPQIKLLIEKDILWLDIAMRDALSMHIGDSIQEKSKIRPRRSFREPSHHQIIEQLPSLNVF